MTQSDKWKTNPNHPDPKKRQRLPVTRYFAFKDTLRILSAKASWQLPDVLNIVFLIRMPETWSNKKKREMLFTAHKCRPDRDNYLKAVQDTFDVDDGYVWDGRTTKLWSHTPAIMIY
jgi:Holliday junction resolvase RusA-like endonuclease